jgi:probable F420-dependent oxidoreductase
MRFGFHLFMVNPAELADIARACDESGWDHLAVGDSPYHPEVIAKPYPYTPDGKRFWPLDDPILDPWVAITHMAMVTKRLRFITSVLRMSVRKPLLEAKAACSVAVVSNDRLGVGVGLAWMAEEFRFLHEDMKTRGARVDEAIQILRLCMGGGFVEFHGKYYDFDRLIMEPHPKKRVPIYVGGISKPAMHRAARYGDGWLGAMHSIEEIKQIVPEMMRQRKEYGREKEPFDIFLQCPEVTSVDDMRRLEDLGVNNFWVVPWFVYAARAEKERLAAAQGAIPTLFNAEPSLQVKLDAIRRYGDEVISKFQ